MSAKFTEYIGVRQRGHIVKKVIHDSRWQEKVSGFTCMITRDKAAKLIHWSVARETWAIAEGSSNTVADAIEDIQRAINRYYQQREEEKQNA